MDDAVVDVPDEVEQKIRSDYGEDIYEAVVEGATIDEILERDLNGVREQAGEALERENSLQEVVENAYEQEGGLEGAVGAIDTYAQRLAEDVKRAGLEYALRLAAENPSVTLE